MKQIINLWALLLLSIGSFSADLYIDVFTGKVVDLSTCERDEGGYQVVKVSDGANTRIAYSLAGDAQNATVNGSIRNMFSTLLAAQVTGSDITILTAASASAEAICGNPQSYALKGAKIKGNSAGGIEAKHWTSIKN